MSERVFFLLPGARRDARPVCEHINELDDNVVWRVTIEQRKQKRSEEQLGYYWAVVVKLLSEHTGYETHEVHHVCCGLYFGWKDRKVPRTPRNPQGVESVPIRTTSVNERGRYAPLTILKFAEFCDFVIRIASEKFGIAVPPPDKDWKAKRDAKAGAA